MILEEYKNKVKEMSVEELNREATSQSLNDNSEKVMFLFNKHELTIHPDIRRGSYDAIVEATVNGNVELLNFFFHSSDMYETIDLEEMFTDLCHDEFIYSTAFIIKKCNILVTPKMEEIFKTLSPEGLQQLQESIKDTVELQKLNARLNNGLKIKSNTSLKVKI